jgi:hypothetical protein
MDGEGIFAFALIVCLVVPFFLMLLHKKPKIQTKEERDIIREQAREALRRLEEEKLRKVEQQVVNSQTQQSLITSLKAKQTDLLAELGKLGKDIEQAQKVLEELQIKEHLSKLSKEELLEDAYLREVKGNSLEGLSQEELDTVLGVLTKLRSSKE